MEWCTIESDPAVFTELLEKIGVKGVSVEEVYTLDDEDHLRQLGHIHGLIFLFRYTKNTEQRATLVDFDPELFYARQVVTNACGTQALLSVVLNIPGLEMTNELKEFKEFAVALDPESRGYALGESELLRKNHNLFAKPEPFIYQQNRKAKDGDDVFHFIAYIPFKKQVYELDGIERGPILLGEVSDTRSWIDIAREEINKRMEK
jgi:ubiquitin carboxyl-terminal hydrolase L5